MPFMPLDLGPLSVALLQAELRSDGVRCDAAYLGFDLARAIGVDDYELLSTHGVMLGEWIFAGALNDRPPTDDEVDAVVHANRAFFTFSDRSRDQLVRLRTIGTRFIHWAVTARPWAAYDIVGFSSTFQQNVASLALGRALKDRYPDLPLAYGGSNWQGEMGLALHEAFPWVDYAAVGEGDRIIVDLVRAARGEVDPATIPGLVHRRHGASILGRPPLQTEALDDLPVPDYEDWLDQRRRALVVNRPPTLVFESSRGCWWGERSHCTFCGLNAEGMVSRRKSAGRVLAELQAQRARTGVNDYMAADTILPTGFFVDLLPALAAVTPRFDLFYEIKTNLGPARVKALADAGVTRIQPGIESLSDNVLRLIRKGSTALQNVQVLRWCREFGIEPDWPILVGIPGDTRADYEQFRRVADRCHHLPPPALVQEVQIHRFSPFHETPEALGFTDVRPLPVYRLCYDLDDDHLARIAYKFVGRRTDTDDGHRHVEPMLAAVADWKDHTGGGLWMQPADAGLLITDERGATPTSRTLEGWQAQVFEACDRIQSRRGLARRVPEVPADALGSFLTTMVDDGLLLHEGHRYLALPVHRPARADLEPEPERRRLAVTTARPG